MFLRDPDLDPAALPGDSPLFPNGIEGRSRSGVGVTVRQLIGYNGIAEVSAAKKYMMTTAAAKSYHPAVPAKASGMRTQSKKHNAVVITDISILARVP